MKLHFRELGTGSPLLILHGLFGSSDNWQTLAKYLAKEYKIYLIDLRNHGRSPHSPDFNYDVMKQDILQFMQDQQLPEATIMGHSMGGKVAMNFALRHADMVTRLIVVDIAPKFYRPHHQDILAALHAVNLAEVTNRTEVDEALAQHIQELDVRMFLAKNLYRKEDNSFAWRMNFPVIEQHIEEVGQETKSATPFPKPTLFIRGANSRYIKPDEDTATIEKIFPAAKIETIENAGHWVHAEAPEKFYNLLINFLAEEGKI
ncbi:alpha/beta fold hydrolase [Adhaeribacter aquaticus]|uniref:alpha/beta fold hydrolase n=1 Tax=Adhaeribacter aquaticus TaxID=299567 RepID=UPI000421A052|nr:alpha/beta fold hydrolase [Adhaeribacter aquaticus]